MVTIFNSVYILQTNITDTRTPTHTHTPTHRTHTHKSRSTCSVYAQLSLRPSGSTMLPSPWDISEQKFRPEFDLMQVRCSL